MGGPNYGGVKDGNFDLEMGNHLVGGICGDLSKT